MGNKTPKGVACSHVVEKGPISKVIKKMPTQQEKAARVNRRMCAGRGAPPHTITLTFPPRRARTLEKAKSHRVFVEKFPLQIEIRYI